MKEETDRFNKKSRWILIAIIVLAAFLRFWQLGQVPPSPDWDEAALGYNAYSLLKTGKDEYGQAWPLILRSFDDYKPAIYAYLAIFPVKLFGLNLWAVRLPAAIIGTLTVLLVYYLVKELFPAISPRRSTFAHHPRCLALPLIASFLLAISPWHLQFSRVAFETAVGMAINVLVALLFLKSLKKPWLLPLVAFLAGLNIYVYQAEKIFTPLLVLVLVVVWHRTLLKIPRRWLAIAFIVGLVTVVPFIRLALTTPEVFTRAKGTSFASDQTPFLSRTAQKLIRDQENRDYLGLVLDNRRVTYFLAFLSGYLSHFDINWLFIAGDDTRHHAPGMGLLYLVELPFLLLGIYQLIFDRQNSKAKYFIAAWLVLAPLPAAFTSGVPHAVRALRFLPMIHLLSAWGILAFVNWLRRQRLELSYGLAVLALAAFLFNFGYYFNQYFVQLNYFTSQTWQYGYEQAVAEVKKIESKYDKIIVSNQPHLDQSYVFFLYYLEYDPAKYQQEGGTVSGGFAEDRNAFGKFEFRPIIWNDEEKSERILYVGRPEDFPGEKPVVKTFYFLNGKPAIKLVEGK